MDNCPFDSNSNTKLPPLSSFTLPMPTAFSLVNKKEGEELKKLQIERLELSNSPNQLTTQKHSREIPKSLTVNKEMKGPEVLSKGSGNYEKKTEGRWTNEEHNKFLEGMEKFGKNWKKIQQYIGTRSGTQIRSHAQKYFMKQKGLVETDELSPPRKHSGSKSDEAKEVVESTPEPVKENPEISLQEFASSFFPISSQVDIIPPLSNYISKESSNVSYILEELSGARQLEILCNRVAETFASLNSVTFNPERLPRLQKELISIINDLRTLFPSIALNPLLCEKWSEILKSAVGGFRLNGNSNLSHNDNQSKVPTQPNTTSLKALGRDNAE